jgi:hypothetical protein
VYLDRRQECFVLNPVDVLYLTLHALFNFPTLLPTLLACFASKIRHFYVPSIPTRDLLVLCGRFALLSAGRESVHTYVKGILF